MNCAEGEQIIEIILIEDAYRAIDLILIKGRLNQIYNVGSSEIMKIESFLNDAKEKL